MNVKLRVRKKMACDCNELAISISIKVSCTLYIFLQKDEAMLLMKYMQSFEFIFILHLMKKVLPITHKLS